jgi:hypothetical protein
MATQFNKTVVSFEFQCCFCRAGIPLKDTCALVIVSNWGTDAREKGQQFFCHLVCFERVTGEKVEAVSADGE